MNIKGPYLSFGKLETAIIGFVAFMSGVATKAARCRVAAWDKKMLKLWHSPYASCGSTSH